MNVAIILAAGGGTRLKSTKNIPKAMALLENKPMYFYSFETFCKMKTIDKIIITVPKGFEKKVSKEICKTSEKTIVISGGNSRFESLQNAINVLKEKCAPKDDDIIISHDAARIFISSANIQKIINCCKENEFSTTACKIVDTMYSIENNKSKIINRDNSYYIQTPQASLFKFWNKNIINKDGTDLISCMKLQLKKKNIIEGNNGNFKITQDNDLLIAKLLVKNLKK